VGRRLGGAIGVVLALTLVLGSLPQGEVIAAGPSPTATATEVLGVNCAGFASQKAAQTYLRQHPTDPQHLDGDGDGLACERRPAPYDLTPVPTPTTTGGSTGSVTVAVVPTPTVRRIDIFGRRFTPSVVRVTVGSTVQWRNGDRVKHTVTGTLFHDKTNQLFRFGPLSPGSTSPLPEAPVLMDSGPLAPRPDPAYPGAKRPEPGPDSYFTFTFTQAGTYSYHCAIHANMAGTIVVDSTDTQGGSGNNSGGGAPPPPATPTPVVNPVKLVTAFGNRFRPDRVTVVQGTTVKFRNGDRKDHTISGSTYRDANGTFWQWSPNPDPQSGVPIASEPALSGTIYGRPPPEPGASGASRPETATLDYVFADPGVYTYQGELPQMRGTIVVVTPAANR